MKYCTACGHGIPDDAAFCSACGRQQESVAAGPPLPQSQPGMPPPPAVQAEAAPAKRRLRLPRIPLKTAAIGLGVFLLVALVLFLLVGRTTRGSLLSLSTGEPIAGATIRSDSGTAKTDAAGVFTMSSLHIGTHEVTVTAKGYAPYKTTLHVAAIGGGNNELRMPDSSVSVHVVEIAKQPQTVTDSDVHIDDKAASADASGTYTIKGLRTGPATITVSSPSHEPTTVPIDLKPGVNDLDINVSLTPAETYTRYYEAYKADQWKVAYGYLHPDVVKRESLSTYTNDMKAWGKPVSIDMQGTKMLPKWTSPYTSVTYTDVAEVRRTLVSMLKGGRLQSSKPQHWVNVNGMWLRVDL